MGSFTSNSPDETFELGRQWAADVSAGWVIGLMGDLGTGKTQLVKGLAAGLGVEATVNSPTFALLQEHDEGRLPLAHIDLYRLETPAEIVGAGLEQQFSQLALIFQRRQHHQLRGDISIVPGLRQFVRNIQ